MKDPNDSFNSTVLLLRNIGETHEWEITVTGQGQGGQRKGRQRELSGPRMSRFTFRGSRREADDMAIEARLSFEVKLEAIARNVKARPATAAAPHTIAATVSTEDDGSPLPSPFHEPAGPLDCP